MLMCLQKLNNGELAGLKREQLDAITDSQLTDLPPQVQDVVKTMRNTFENPNRETPHTHGWPTTDVIDPDDFLKTRTPVSSLTLSCEAQCLSG